MKIVLMGLCVNNRVISEELICESITELWGSIIVNLLNHKVEGKFFFSLVPLDYQIVHEAVEVNFDYEQLTIFNVEGGVI